MGEINYKKLAELHIKMYDCTATRDERLNYALTLCINESIDDDQFEKFKQDPWDVELTRLLLFLGGVVLLPHRLNLISNEKRLYDRLKNNRRRRK